MASRLDFSQIRSLYVGTSSSTQVDTNNLIVAGNVGIGTTSPSNKLTVYQGGGVRVTGISAGDYIELSGNLPGYADNTYPVIKSNGSIHFANNGKYAAFLEGANTYFGILDNSANTRVFLTTSGASYLTGGNVLIGTTTDAGYKLDVNGTFRSQGILNVQGGYYENEQLLVGIGETKYLYVDIANTSGNVEVLVGGYGGAGSASCLISWIDGGHGAGTPYHRLIQIARQTQGNPVLGNVIQTATGGAISIQNTGGAAIALWVTTRSYGSNSVAANAYLSDTAPTGNNASILNVDDINSRVGIGTTAPSNKLHIDSAEDNAYALRVQGNTNNSAGVWTGIGIAGEGANTKTAILFEDVGQSYSRGRLIFALNDAADQTSATPANAVMTLTPGGNVGIGTTSPDAKLVVTGDGSGTAKIGPAGFGGNYTGISLNGTLNTVSYNFLSSTSDNHLYINRPTGNDIYFRLANNDQVAIKSSGNVGIGTTAPTWKLQTESSSSTVAMFRSSDSNTIVGIDNSAVDGDPQLKFYINDIGTFTLGVDDSDSDKFKIGTSDLTTNTRLTIDGSGNVGIGTTAPGYKLDVNGDMYANGDIRSQGIFRDYQGEALLQTDTSAVTQLGSGGAGTPRQLAFLAGNAERVRITAAGNVGIGTTAPSTPLEVAGTLTLKSSAEGGPHIYRDGDNAGDIRFYSTNGTFASPTAKSATGLLGQIHYAGYDGSSYITAAQIWAVVDGTVSTGVLPARLEFKTGTSGAATQMTIKSSGNVGIGTTSPSYKLDVSGSARVNSTSNLAMFVKTNSAFGAAISYEGSTTGGNDVVHAGAIGSNFYIATGYSERVRVTSGGNVGIGTTAPTEKLHVNGNAVLTYNNSYQGINSVGNKAILARVSPTTGIVNYAEYATAANLNGFVMGSDDARVKGNIATDSLEFITNASERMRITSAGNVGIGTSSPSNILHITDVMRMDNVSAYSPNLSSTSAPKYGYGDVSNERYLAEPVIWLKINVDGTEYVIPGYTEVI